MGTRFWRFSHLIIQQFLYSVIRASFIVLWLSLAQSAHSNEREQNILVFGDSISAAYGMSLEQGWVAQLAEVLEAQNRPYTVINASISGETTAGGLRRFPALLSEYEPTIVIIELGANDGLRGYPLGTLKKNLLQMVELAQQNNAKVILLPMRIPPNYGSRYTKGFFQTYQQVAQKTSSVLAPFILEQVALNPALVQEDGIHPTVEAQPLMLDTLLPTILRELTD